MDASPISYGRLDSPGWSGAHSHPEITIVHHEIAHHSINAQNMGVATISKRVGESHHRRMPHVAGAAQESGCRARRLQLCCRRVRFAASVRRRRTTVGTLVCFVDECSIPLAIAIAAITHRGLQRKGLA